MANQLTTESRLALALRFQTKRDRAIWRERRGDERRALTGRMEIGLDVEGELFVAAHDGDGNGVAGGDEKRCIEHVFGFVDWFAADLKENVTGFDPGVGRRGALDDFG